MVRVRGCLVSGGSGDGGGYVGLCVLGVPLGVTGGLVMFVLFVFRDFFWDNIYANCDGFTVLGVSRFIMRLRGGC